MSSEKNKKIISNDQDKIGEKASSHEKKSWRLRFFALAVIILITFVTVTAASYFISGEEKKLEVQLKQRIEILVLERGEIFSTWLAGIANQSRPITGSEVFRLFAMEVDKADGDVTTVLDASDEEEVSTEDEMSYERITFKDQLPYMINALTDLVQDTDYKAAYLVDRSGNSFLANIDAKPLLREQKLVAMRLFETAQVEYSGMRASDDGLEFDIYVPVVPADYTESVNRISGVFIFTVDVGDRLKILLQPNPITGLQGNYSLYQTTPDVGVEEIRPVGGDAIFKSNLPASVFNDNILPFSERQSLGGMEEVYSFGVSIKKSPFYLVWQSPVTDVRSQLDKLILNTCLISLFFIFSFVMAFGAFWWRSNSEHNRSLADQYARFAGRIHRQKLLLDTINNTIKELISLKSLQGKYTYVNPAFAEAVGQPLDDIVGRDAASVLGHGTAERMERLDEMALNSQEPVVTIDEVYLQGIKKHLQISKVPVTTEDEKSIVTVARDITDLVEEQERRERSIKQTVSALVRAVEIRDPHLAGHSKRVAEFGAIVAHDLSTDQKLKRTVEIAANLSQIGRLEIDADLLTADRRLSDEEIKVIQGHVMNAEKIVSEIEFDVPVAKAIGHMYERLDGSGYPRGLKGDDISLEGRILGVCDYFCARIEPRSYRSAILPKDAIHFLEQNPSKYDPKVVAALKKIVQSTIGEKIIASVDRAKEA